MGSHWGQAGCRDSQPCWLPHRCLRQQLQTTTCCGSELAGWGTASPAQGGGSLKSLNGCLTPPLQLSCLSEGEQHPVLLRQGSGGRGWGHRRYRSGVRTMAGVYVAMALGPPVCTKGDAGAARRAAARWQPRGRGCAAQRGRGGGGTPPPPLFFSHRGRHTPLPATALPAPAAIIRRAAGGQGGRALPGGVTPHSGRCHWSSRAVLGTRPPAMLPAKGCWVVPSARRPVLGAAAMGPSLPTLRGSWCGQQRAAGMSLPGQSRHAGRWRNPLPASCPVLCAFKDTGSSL